jgi:DNA (cytosine-5)-methyltransferase 1
MAYGISAYESNAMKSANPHSGIYEADTTRTLDNNGGNPACNQGGMIVLEGNGSRPSHQGDGYKESEVSYTLNSVEQHAVCWDGGQISPTLTANNAGGGQRMPDKDNFNAVITYGIDRASFNQGKNAQYDFQVQEEIAQTIVAKGPGGVLTHK